MARRSIRSLLEHGYMLAVSLYLLWDLAYMTEADFTFSLPPVLRGAGVLLALVPLMRRGRPAAMWLSVAFLVWMGAVSAWTGGNVLTAQRPAIGNGVIAMMVLLPAACVADGRKLTAWTRLTLALWTAALTMQALIGLWAMLTGHAVFSLRGTWYIGLNRGDHRLYLNAYVTTGAVKMGLSVLLAAFGAVLERKWPARVAYGLCAAAMLLCLALTDCRTAFIAAGLCLGLMAATVGRKHLPRGKGWRRIAATVLIVLIVTVGVYGGLSGFVSAVGPRVPYDLDNLTLLELPEHLLPEASAEAAEAGVQHRNIEQGNVFNGRAAVWKAAIALLIDQPHLLLTGTTAAQAPAYVNGYVAPAAGQMFYHVHDIYLHVLVAWGIPGAAVMGAAIVLFLLAAWRVMFRRDLPAWMRLLPVPTLFMLICDTVDCFMLFSAGSPTLYFACFFAGWTLIADQRARKGASA